MIFEKLNPVATCRVYFSDQRQNYVIGRIAVLKKFRGMNYGAELLKIAETEVIKRQGNRLELSDQVRVSNFYVKNGYIPSDEVYDDEGCPHVWMRKELR